MNTSRSTELSALDYERNERAHMPAQLRTARLVLSEQTLQCDLPVKLIARVDQAFLVSGMLVLVETKTRFRLETTPYDVLELSVQRTILRHSTDPRIMGVPVSPYAYVRIVRPDQKPHYELVELVDDATVAAYHHRYHALTRGALPEGQIPLRGAYDSRVCDRCPMQNGCPYQPQ